MKTQKADHCMTEVVPSAHAKHGKVLKLTTPQSVLRIDSVEELKAQLDHYNNPFITLVLPNSQFARKQYVEKTRPALRYYCAKFDVPVPAWLKSDDYFKKLPDSEKQNLFGTTKLSFREFTKMPTAQPSPAKSGGKPGVPQ